MRPSSRFVPLFCAVSLAFTAYACGPLFDARSGTDTRTPVSAGNGNTPAVDGNTNMVDPNDAAPSSPNTSVPSTTPSTGGTNTGDANGPSTTPTTPTTSTGMTDKHGCVVATVKFTGNIDTIFKRSCVSCHSSFIPMNNYTQIKASFTGNTSESEIESGDMPRGSTLSMDDKCKVFNWISSGYPQ